MTKIQTKQPRLERTLARFGKERYAPTYKKESRLDPRCPFTMYGAMFAHNEHSRFLTAVKS